MRMRRAKRYWRATSPERRSSISLERKRSSPRWSRALSSRSSISRSSISGLGSQRPAHKKSKACALLLLECVVFNCAPGFHPVAAAAREGAPEDSSPDLGFWPSSLSLLGRDASHISQVCHVKCDGSVAKFSSAIAHSDGISVAWHVTTPWHVLDPSLKALLLA